VYRPVAARTAPDITRARSSSDAEPAFQPIVNRLRMELLRDVVPGLRRLAIMANVGYPEAVREMGAVQAMAGVLGLEVALREIRIAIGAALTRQGPTQRVRAGSTFLSTGHTFSRSQRPLTWPIPATFACAER
jgi:putative tryptophan/tyrosine transport system substrate-binding protein